MAQTTLISSISRSTAYPVSVQATADNCCGTLSLIIPNAWSEQMLMELPTINISIFMEDGTKLKSFNINMTTVNNEIKNAQSTDAYSIPIYDIPESFTFSIIPLFDKFALSAHNHNVENGNIEIFNTSSAGIVDTDIEDYSSRMWTTDTQTFNVKIVFDNSNISASGGSGGGGGGGSITVDTQVLPNSINPVQNRAIYDFVNSSVSTNTAYFIGTFNSVADLEAYSGSVSNNDYAFVIGTDSDSNTIYNRYKYNGSTETWEFEYALNNSSFTAAEWETIQSGLTAQDKTNYNNHLSNANNPHFVTKSQVGLGNVDNTSDVDKPVSTATQTALNGKQDTLTFDGTYDASTNKVATVSTVTNAINDLDVSSVGGSGKYISAISETNGKISPTVETMDTTPTSDSEKAVTSGAVYTALATKQDALSQAQLAAANSGITAAKLTADEAALAEVVNNGAKNVLRFDAISRTSHNGVDFTYNADGSVTVNAASSASDNAFCYLNLDGNNVDVKALCDGNHVIAGCPTNSGGVTLRVIGTGYTTVTDSGNGATMTTYSGENVIRVAVYVAKNGTPSNIKVKPMICTKAAWDVSHAFEPYALSNPVITPALIEQVDNGAKNHLYWDINVVQSANTNGTWSGNTFAHNSGVTFTVNGDSSITVNGTASGVNGVFVLSTDFTISQGDWVLSGTPIGGSPSTYNTTIAGVISDIGNTARFSSATKKLVRIYIIAGTTVNNLPFKPMICTAADWAVSQKYVPYCPTMQEMYQMILTLQSGTS